MMSKLVLLSGSALIASVAGIEFKDTAFRRIQSIAREDLEVIAETEEQLDTHVSQWFEVVHKAQELLGLASAPEAAKPINAVVTKVTEKKSTTAAKSNSTTDADREELKNLEKEMADQHAKTDGVRAALNSVMGPAMMVPVLQEMYGKFKGDIKRATQQENRAKVRVVDQQKQYDEWKKEGKTYLLQDKQRVIDYYKRQRDIQHKHYHAMLKMAHSMMERIKMVKGMCGKAANHEGLSEKEKQELRMMAPNAGK